MKSRKECIWTIIKCTPNRNTSVSSYFCLKVAEEWAMFMLLTVIVCCIILATQMSRYLGDREQSVSWRHGTVGILATRNSRYPGDKEQSVSWRQGTVGILATRNSRYPSDKEQSVSWRQGTVGILATRDSRYPSDKACGVWFVPLHCFRQCRQSILGRTVRNWWVHMYSCILPAVIFPRPLARFRYHSHVL
jgi:hypothetical protein